MSRRCAVLASLDLLLVTVLLLAYGSSQFSWLAGPLSAAAIWGLDCAPRRVRPQQSRRGTAPSGLESSASRG